MKIINSEFNLGATRRRFVGIGLAATLLTGDSGRRKMSQPRRRQMKISANPSMTAKAWMAATISHSFITASPRAGAGRWPPSAGCLGRQAKSLPPDAERRRSVHSRGGFVHHPQCVVDGEAVGLLDRREVLEGLSPLGRRRLRSVQDVDVVKEPVVVGVRRLIGALVRVGAQIEELRHAAAA